MKNGKRFKDGVYLYILPGLTALCGVAMTVLSLWAGNGAAACVLGVLFVLVPAGWLVYACRAALRRRKKAEVENGGNGFGGTAGPDEPDGYRR